MMARAVIRDPGNPSFVLNFQVRVADWDQGHGNHQGQRRTVKPRSKAGHRTVLASRAIGAFSSCKAGVIHTGRSRLMLMRRMQVQQIFFQAVRASQ